MNMRVSIIIPTRNSDKYLDLVLTSIKKQTYKDIETIVVDCFSSDKTLEVAKKHKARIINFPKEGDYRSGQKNLGARKAKGRMLLFLDSDAQLTPHVVAECVSLVKEGNDMVIIPEKHIGKGFWARSKALERQCYLGDDTIECPWFFDKKVFLEVGGYVEDMISGEDWDLFSRLRKAGYKYARNSAFIEHNLGNLRFFSYVNKKRYYGGHIKKYITRNKASAIRKIPFFRPAYIRNWRLLIRYPHLSAGFMILKVFESLFFFWGMFEGETE